MAEENEAGMALTKVTPLMNPNREIVDDDCPDKPLLEPEVTNFTTPSSLEPETVVTSDAKMPLSLQLTNPEVSSLTEVTNVPTSNLEPETVVDKDEVPSDAQMTSSADGETVDDSHTDMLTQIKPCSVLLNRREVTSFIRQARKRKREQMNLTRPASLQSPYMPASVPPRGAYLSSSGNQGVAWVMEEAQQPEIGRDVIEDRIDSIINQNQLLLNSVNPLNFSCEELKMAIKKPILLHPKTRASKPCKPKSRKKATIDENCDKNDELNCRLCPSNFTSFDEYIEHYGSEHDKQFEFRCKTCLISFPTVSLINDHIKIYHSKTATKYMSSKFFIDIVISDNVIPDKIESTCTCNFCYVNFPSQLSLLDHQTKFCHEYAIMLNLPCLYCENIYNNKHFLVVHLVNDHHACKICNETFKNANELKEHDVKHTSGKILFTECSMCKEHFKTVEEFEKHCENDHPYISDITSTETVKAFPGRKKHSMQNDLVCGYCDKFFVRRQDLIYHLRIRHNVMKCSTCKNNFIFKDLNSNMCKHCKVSKQRDNITDEESSIVEQEDATPTLLEYANDTFPCLFCRGMFRNDCSLQIHVARSHNRVRFENPEIVLTDGIVYRCQICLLIFKDFKAFSSHCIPYTAFPHLSQICNICNICILSDKEFRKHCQDFHDDKYCHKCRICEKGYTSLEKLTFHVIRYHNNNTVCCKLCNADVTAADYFNTHVLYHKKTKLSPCPFCCDFIKGSKLLQLHVKSHLNLDSLDFDYDCEICYNHFYNENNLKFHQYVSHCVSLLKDEDENSSSDGEQSQAAHIEPTLPSVVHKTVPSNSILLSRLTAERVMPMHTEGVNVGIPILPSQSTESQYVFDEDESDYKMEIVDNPILDGNHGDIASNVVPSTEIPSNNLENFQARANAACKICYSLVYTTYFCLICKRKFINPCSFYIHFIRIHEKGYLGDPEKLCNGKKVFQCQICFTEFQNANYFFAHCSPYIYYYKLTLYCSKCDIKFEKSLDLENHYINVHLDSKCFQCRICNNAFSEYKQLTSHVTASHSNCLVFCSACQVDFPEGMFFSSHLHKVHNETLNCCPYCKEIINNIKLFSVHIKAHMNNTSKDLMCEICLNYFYSKYNLNLHKKKVHCVAIETAVIPACHTDTVNTNQSSQVQTRGENCGGGTRMNNTTQFETCLLHEIKEEVIENQYQTESVNANHSSQVENRGENCGGGTSINNTTQFETCLVHEIKEEVIEDP